MNLMNHRKLFCRLLRDSKSRIKPQYFFLINSEYFLSTASDESQNAVSTISLITLQFLVRETENSKRD